MPVTDGWAPDPDDPVRKCDGNSNTANKRKWQIWCSWCSAQRQQQIGVGRRGVGGGVGDGLTTVTTTTAGAGAAAAQRQRQMQQQMQQQRCIADGDGRDGRNGPVPDGDLVWSGLTGATTDGVGARIRRYDSCRRQHGRQQITAAANKQITAAANPA